MVCVQQPRQALIRQPLHGPGGGGGPVRPRRGHHDQRVQVAQHFLGDRRVHRRAAVDDRDREMAVQPQRGFAVDRGIEHPARTGRRFAAEHVQAGRIAADARGHIGEGLQVLVGGQFPERAASTAGRFGCSAGRTRYRRRSPRRGPAGGVRRRAIRRWRRPTSFRRRPCPARRPCSCRAGRSGWPLRIGPPARCAADGPSLTRPKVTSRRMRRQPRSGEFGAGGHARGAGRGRLRAADGPRARRRAGGSWCGAAGRGGCRLARRGGRRPRAVAAEAARLARRSGSRADGGAEAAGGAVAGDPLGRATGRACSGGAGLVGLQTVPQEFVALVHGLLGAAIDPAVADRTELQYQSRAAGTSDAGTGSVLAMRGVVHPRLMAIAANLCRR